MTPGAIAQLACILEVTARKPGNVHRFADFHDLCYLDFLLSARAIAKPLDRARQVGIGRTVLDCVRATKQFVKTNTNLGMILLLAPFSAVPEDGDLREGVIRVIQATTVDDARYVYEAIRLAMPGGIGQVDDQDISTAPTMTLLETMRLAADRDSVARQYANGFSEVFDVTLPLLRTSIESGQDCETAIISAYLATLAKIPDSLIARKIGQEEARSVSLRARAILDAGWPDEPAKAHCREFDTWLRTGGHSRNPGSTADLVAAALFAALRDGTIRFPLTQDFARVSPTENEVVE